MRRRFIHRMLAVLALVVLMLGPAPPVAAHAELARAEPPVDAVLPEPPERLTLHFTETIEPRFSEVVVLGANGQPVHTTSAEASADRLSMTLELPTLSNSAYTVTWRTLSTVDGHTTRGFYALTIGQATTVTPPPPVVADSGPPAWVEAIIRWLIFTAQAVLVGCLLFVVLVLAPVRARLAPANGATDPVSRRVTRVAAIALGALAAGSVAALLAQAMTIQDRSFLDVLGPPLARVVGETRYGAIWLTRAVILLALAGLLLARRQRPVDWFDWLAVGLGSALLFTTTLTSHGAATREMPFVAMTADWLHLLATSAWLGGLVALAVIMPVAMRSVPEDRRLRLLSRVVGRFGRLALVCVAVLVVTGAYAAYLHVGEPGALLTSDYGRALLLKLAFFLPMVGLGGFNHLWLRPRLARAVPTQGRVDTGLAAIGGLAYVALRQTVRAELALGLLILAATGLMTSLSPARQIVPFDGFMTIERVNDLELTLQIAPAQPGQNTITLTVTQGGRPVDTVTRALLRVSYLDGDFGETEIVLTPAGEGRYMAMGGQFGIMGQWQAEMIIRRDGQDDARTAVRFAIPVTAAGPVAAPPGTVSPLQRLTVPGWIALVILAVAGVIIVVGLRSRAPALTGGLIGSGAAAILLAVYLIVTQGTTVPAAPAGPANPYPPTAQSLALGRTLYNTHCVSCHGVEGRGDGPQAAALPVPPADFTQHVGFHSEAELYRMISQGIRGTPMPPFAGILTDAERWHLVNYIRTFDATTGAGRAP